MKTLHKDLYQLCDDMDMRNVRIPIAPSFLCKSISVMECSIFNSLTKPMKIIVKGKRNSYGIIYKVKIGNESQNLFELRLAMTFDKMRL
jgi:hypothetical protein